MISISQFSKQRQEMIIIDIVCSFIVSVFVPACLLVHRDKQNYWNLIHIRQAEWSACHSLSACLTPINNARWQTIHGRTAATACWRSKEICKTQQWKVRTTSALARLNSLRLNSLRLNGLRLNLTIWARLSSLSCHTKQKSSPLSPQQENRPT